MLAEKQESRVGSVARLVKRHCHFGFGGLMAGSKLGSQTLPHWESIIRRYREVHLVSDSASLQFITHYL